MVWLLRRFLYRPVLNAIDEREKKIAAQLANAELQKAEAGKERSTYLAKNETFDNERKSLMDKAMAEAESERQNMLEKSRNEAATLSKTLQAALNENQAQLHEQIAANTRRQVFAIARKALTDLASADLNEYIATMFVQKLKSVSASEKALLNEALKTNSNQVIISSAFELPDKLKNEINVAITGLLGTTPVIHYKINDTLIGGIELTAGGYKLAWGIAAYLNSLEKEYTGNTVNNSRYA